MFKFRPAKDWKELNHRNRRMALIWFVIIVVIGILLILGKR
jgi:hypothetical protein